MRPEEYKAFIRKHPEMERFFEWVSPGSDGRRGFYRVIPHTRFNPHPNQLRTMINFAKAGYDAYNKKGFRVVEGQLLPVVAAEIKGELSGKKVKVKADLRVLEKLTRIQQLMKVVAK